MNNQRTIYVVTGSRAEYGLLIPLMKEIEVTKDLMGTILFLCSDLSEFICGQNIIVDDGFSL